MAFSDNLRTSARSLGGTIALLLLFSVGCGSDTDSGQTVAPPPLEPKTEPLTSGGHPSEPPGTMEMPKDADTGSQPAKSESERGMKMPESTSQNTNAPPVNPNVDVEIASWDKVAEAIKSSDKVTVVDIWSTT